MARVALFREFLLHLVGELGLQARGELGLPAKFWTQSGSAFRSNNSSVGRLPKFICQNFGLPFSTLVEQDGLSRAAVTVQVAGFGVASRPTVCLVIADVELVSLYDASNGVAAVGGASDVVSFLSDEDMVALGDDLSGFGRVEDVGQAAPGHGLHDGGGGLDAGDFQEGGGQVGES